MDVIECIYSRRSVRKYTKAPVEWEKIGLVIEAGCHAPSSGNLQNWRFVVVTDRQKRKEIAEACLQQRWIESAPVHIVVCAEPEKAEQFYGIRGERLYSIQNCAAAVQNMLLAAHNYGLASCWVGAFEEEMLKRSLGIPDNIRPQAVVPLGYPAETPRPTPRAPLYDKVYPNSYGTHCKDIGHVMGYHSGKVRKVLDKGKEILEAKHDEKVTKTYNKGKEFFKGIFKSKK